MRHRQEDRRHRRQAEDAGFVRGFQDDIVRVVGVDRRVIGKRPQAVPERLLQESVPGELIERRPLAERFDIEPAQIVKRVAE